MNEFLKYVLFRLELEAEIIEELIKIDNEILCTNFQTTDLLNYLQENINNKKLLNLELKTKSLAITEGNPIIVLQLLNDFALNIDKLFISRSFVAMNSWLFKKVKDYYQELGKAIDIEIDIEKNYQQYLSYQGDILVIGDAEFVKGTAADFKKELIKYPIE